jgi:hypothetical protein
MRRLGSPTIRAIRTRNGWVALEGSHRLAAAAALNKVVYIRPMDPDDVIYDHDFAGRIGQPLTAQQMVNLIRRWGFNSYEWVWAQYE